ncbi:hypothetical protein PTKIN_Ptkin09bG0055700 [Pterospermum kingtungense]
MATKEVTSEEEFESKDGVGNHSGKIITIMTDLPNGVGAKCNGEVPGEMNSMKNDSPESQVKPYLLDETQKFSLEVSKTVEKDMVLRQKATLVSEEPENGNTNHFHSQIQPGEELIEISNGQGSKEQPRADDPCDSKNCDKEDTDKKYEEEDSEEKEMIKETLEKVEDSNPVGNAFLSPSPYLVSHALTDQNLQEDSHLESKKVQNSNESMEEVKLESLKSSGEFSTTEASSFAPQTLTEKNVVSVVELAGEKPTAVSVAETNPSLKQPNEQCATRETRVVANADYYQQDQGRIQEFRLDLT